MPLKDFLLSNKVFAFQEFRATMKIARHAESRLGRELRGAFWQHRNFSDFGLFCSALLLFADKE
jgi:hypothetical protein